MKALEASRQKELIEKERIRIATDMHDDLGSDLSKISIISEVVKKQITDERQQAGYQLDKIISHANGLRKKMDEIIWALNPQYDTVGNLFSYLHEYAGDYFSGTAIKCQIITGSDMPEKNISAFVKRNLFLVVKEALHNVYEHSGARIVKVEMNYSGGKVQIRIEDDGKGLSPELANGKSKGYGLKNMTSRMNDIKGIVIMDTLPGKGCRVFVTCPL